MALPEPYMLVLRLYCDKGIKVRGSVKILSDNGTEFKRTQLGY